MLVASVLEAPELKCVNVWLRTRDAHGLYQQFGFKPAPSPENILIVANHT